MHIEVLTEDSSGAKLVELLMPALIGDHGSPHTWRLHDFKGIGRLPSGLFAQSWPPIGRDEAVNRKQRFGSTTCIA